MAQESAVKQFIDRINSTNNDPNRKAITPAIAARFLLARKYDITRAMALYEQHELIRQREGLYGFDPLNEPLRAELETGKFTILPGRDASGAAIALFTANLHYPMTVTHKTTLQGVVYQLDVALQSTETQKAGLVFIYDMSTSKYSNFDYDLSQKILTLLKGGYPARLKKVLIVTAPLWFKAPFKILRLFVREKLRERVFTVSIPQLSLHVPRESLPIRLGGTLEVDHSSWLLHCYKSMTNREDEIIATAGQQQQQQPQNSQNSSAIVAGANAGNAGMGSAGIAAIPAATGTLDTHHLLSGVGVGSELVDVAFVAAHNHRTVSPSNGTLVEDHLNVDDISDLAAVSANQHLPANHASGGVGHHNHHTSNELWTENPPSSASSGFSDDDSLAGAEGDPKTIEQIVQMVRERGKMGLIREYTEIKARAPDGTFTHAKLRNNLAKNRYTDVLCYDHSRVVLSQEEDDPTTDYINANFVDGYKQKNAYISTQGPLPKTSYDFWRMVWEQHCLLIIMTTRVMERGRAKCGQYWEPSEGGVAEYGFFRLRTMSIETKEDYTVVELEIRNIKTDEVRCVSHWQFTSWPDYGVPSSAKAMLNFLQRAREKQAEMVRSLGDLWAGHPRGPPIVVHCSAGIGRTGTFITLDICISRLEDVGTADIKGTVEKIRSQRAYSIQMPDQYVFCHLALIEYALSRSMLQSVDLSEFDDRDEESD
ncbi:tyrosine-protein phosphatase non-receptor type 9 isoform X2 [Anopheles stephensi]|uniref:tyrosine-protein phosphatase non-receptor type 9 isoform X2 n=1 Tax=Anopheles stephensi TaxID=30069 RepID=UPI0016588862|nr:tyrosine-protein phosphatase non-receptor type 9 isoform X2 [Anopheles stephensi]XP_035919742.1 tyrosine-protein phosphatase non-receptor type 9 isoform X2 [Anopheles stephensi]XP_035919743.1 tyrosine-protein phosphatase non-receptor type 9 isoform X2 [Anopheles stephensi]XP_035919744.1 tyrosine-protein phosphatase non-receptor type 9 isoform X2 [Anopheles stephensi]XP_035919746.1 tyrosine-protein phosphatase non-receptor type 9 isoform X2 [Anopheles stephensi]XP_035919747.1 tyrosine-protei